MGGVARFSLVKNKTTTDEMKRLQTIDKLKLDYSAIEFPNSLCKLMLTGAVNGQRAER